MPHVVTSGCVDHKYQECVAVCPVEAFREADTYLVIDPDECIDCGACIPECPVDAIFADMDVPDEEEAWIDRNADESIDAEIAVVKSTPMKESIIALRDEIPMNKNVKAATLDRSSESMVLSPTFTWKIARG